MHFPDYPFTPLRFNRGTGIEMSYLDEGPRDGDVVLMLHGNPSWNFYWRHLVLGLRDRYRCIAPDHIGMGLSDKPDDKHYRYTLQSRIEDIERLLEHLGITGPVTLAVHDWGGMIGFGWALKRRGLVKRLIITNTSAFPLPKEKPLPWQLQLGRNYNIGAVAIRGFNAFAAGTIDQCVSSKVSPDVRAAYVAPYDSWKNRISTLRFVQDIPLSPKDRSWAFVEESGRTLHEYANRPAFIAWGLQDFVFDHHFLKGFTDALPKAEVTAFEDAHHYVLEDKHAVLVPAMRRFLDANPMSA